MTHQFALPDIGEGLTEAEIVSWRVMVGDEVTINQIVVEIETVKAVVELPSPYAGRIAALHYPVGAVVPVGEPILTIRDGLTTSHAAVKPPAPLDAVANPVPELRAAANAAPEPAAEGAAVLVGYGVSHRPAARRPRRPRPTAVLFVDGRPGYARPPVRKLARDLGVDLHAVTGTRPGCEISRDDVTRAAEALHRRLVGSEQTGVLRTPIRGVRKATAEAMVASAFTAPHVTEWVTVDVTRSMRLLDRLRADSRYRTVRLSPLVVIARAALLAIARHPQINATWDATANEIVQFAEVNLGIAIASPRGLIVPNIKSAQRQSLIELAHALDELITEARAGHAMPSAMSHGTFTITNIGGFGVDGGTPILNPREAGILCVGQIRRQPCNHKGRVRLRDVTTLALSFDHRLIDGELGSRYLAEVAALLEHPARALA